MPFFLALRLAVHFKCLLHLKGYVYENVGNMWNYIRNRPSFLKYD